MAISPDLLLITSLAMLAIALVTTWRTTPSLTGRWRRVMYLLIVSVGIGLLIYPPEVDNQIKSTTAIIGGHIHEDSLRDDQTHYPDIERYLLDQDFKSIDSLVLQTRDLGVATLEGLKDVIVTYAPLRPEVGLAAYEMSPLVAFERGSITGRIIGDADNVSLLTPSGNRIPVAINKSGEFFMSLPGMPAGRYEYTVEMIGLDGDTLSTKIPAEVRENQRYNMLALLSSPAFEVNYLRTFWSAMGYGFGQRMQISTDRYTTVFDNLQQRKLEPFSPESLDGFDLLLLDARQWNRLSITDRRVVKRYIRMTGAALLFLPSDQAPLDINFPAVGTKQQFDFRENGKQVSLSIQSAVPRGWRLIELQDHKVASYRRYGIGHIAALHVADSHKLLLADMERTYQELWTSIITEIFVRIDEGIIADTPYPVWAGEKTALRMYGLGALSDTVTVDRNDTYMATPVPEILGHQRVQVWPEVGWNEVIIGSQDTVWMYAHAKDDAPLLRDERNQDYIRHIAAPKVNVAKMTSKPISRWWAYSLIVLGLSALWLDERIWA